MTETRKLNKASAFFDYVPNVGMVFNTSRWLEARDNGTLPQEEDD